MNPITEALLLVVLASKVFKDRDKTDARHEKLIILILVALGFGRAAWLLIHAALVLVGVL